MRSSSIFQGDAPPKVIVNKCSDGSSVSLSTSPLSAKLIPSGAQTAGTLKTVLSISGVGRVDWLAAAAANTTSRTVRLKVTIDGVVAFDATTAAITASPTAGLIAIGFNQSSSVIGSIQPTPFKSSLLVEVASSLSETDGIQTTVQYFTY